MRGFVLFSAAALLSAQTVANPNELYQRARERVLERVSHLPNFTCVQTIVRRTYAGGAAGKHPPSCDQTVKASAPGKHGSAQISSDRLRVDVAIADKHEVYSWVGAARFEEDDLHKLVGGGQTSMGDFGSLVAAIFNDHPSMHFEGERSVGGKRLLEFSYQTPAESSQYTVKVAWENFVTAYDGSIFLDAQSGELARVTARSAVLPEQTGYCQVSKELEYGHLRMGNADVLIPSEAASMAMDRNGAAMESVSDYSSCREYVGESVLRFDIAEADQSKDAGTTSTGAPPASIPPGLAFDCRIVTPIDSDRAAAGDPIEGVLRSPITDTSGKVLAPEGTRVRGRILTFAQHAAKPKDYFEIGVQLRWLELNGVRVPFAASMVNAVEDDKRSIHLSLHPYVGTFIFYEKKVHATTLNSQWVTATPDAPAANR